GPSGLLFPALLTPAPEGATECRLPDECTAPSRPVGRPMRRWTIEIAASTSAGDSGFPKKQSGKSTSSSSSRHEIAEYYGKPLEKSPGSHPRHRWNLPACDMQRERAERCR